MTETALNWPAEVFETLQAEGITQVCHVPDAGHSRLIKMCEEDNAMSTVTCTTEQEGIYALAGAYLGGAKGVMLLQSSGVGNIINALAMPNTCRIPLLMVATMRGEWGEFNSWQVPMGQGTPGSLEAMGVRLIRVDSPEEVPMAVKAAARLAFDGEQMVAVLISQKVIGFKDFRELAK